MIKNRYEKTQTYNTQYLITEFGQLCLRFLNKKMNDRCVPEEIGSKMEKKLQSNKMFYRCHYQCTCLTWFWSSPKNSSKHRIPNFYLLPSEQKNRVQCWLKRKLCKFSIKLIWLYISIKSDRRLNRWNFYIMVRFM
jgi:hypothetical protein